MEGPRECKKEEFEKVINLINNVFRVSRGLEPTMKEEFPLLLNEENLRNIRIIVEDGKVVASVSFYKTTILIEGIPITTASVGSVCTSENYRGKGYASMLLDDAEKIMKEELVDIILISGTRSLYLRRGCSRAGWCIKFEIYPEEKIDDSIELVEYKDEYLSEMMRIYNQESTRYYRSFYEFKNLLKGATTPWGNYSYKTYLVKKDELFEGYVVLRIIKDETKRGEVVEFCGDRRIIYKSLNKMGILLSLEYINVICPFNDCMTTIVKEKKIKYENINLLGTIKILNFERLMEKLKPYFAQYIDKEVMKKIIFKEDRGSYIFEIGNELLRVNDMDTLTKLIFGDKGQKNYEINIPSTLSSFINSVFPIPFIWTGNLNYQ